MYNIKKIIIIINVSVPGLEPQTSGTRGRHVTHETNHLLLIVTYREHIEINLLKRFIVYELLSVFLKYIINELRQKKSHTTVQI